MWVVLEEQGDLHRKGSLTCKVHVASVTGKSKEETRRSVRRYFGKSLKSTFPM